MKNLGTLLIPNILVFVLAACSSDPGTNPFTPPGENVQNRPALSYLLYTDASNVLRFVNPNDASDRGAVNLSTDNVTQFTTTLAPVAVVYLHELADNQYSERFVYGNVYHEIVTGSTGKLWFVNREINGFYPGGIPVATQISDATDVDISCGVHIAPNYEVVYQSKIIFYQDAACDLPKRATLNTAETYTPDFDEHLIAGSSYYFIGGLFRGWLTNNLGLLKRYDYTFQLANITYANGTDNVDLSGTGASVEVLARNYNVQFLAIKVDSMSDTLIYRLDTTGTLLSDPIQTPEATTYVNPLGTTSDGQYLYVRNANDVMRIAIADTGTTLTRMVTDAAAINRIEVSDTHLVYETSALVKAMPKSLIDQDAQVDTSVKKLINHTGADVAPGLVHIMGPSGVFIYGSVTDYAYFSPYDGSMGSVHATVDGETTYYGKWMTKNQPLAGHFGQDNSVRAENMMLGLYDLNDALYHFSLIDLSTNQRRNSGITAVDVESIVFSAGDRGHFLAAYSDVSEQHLWLVNLNTGVKTVLDTIPSGTFSLNH